MQLDQQPTDLRWVEELAERVFALPGVSDEPSRISVPGARALILARGEPAGPPEAFLIERELAHHHPSPAGPTGTGRSRSPQPKHRLSFVRAP